MSAFIRLVFRNRGRLNEVGFSDSLCFCNLWACSCALAEGFPTNPLVTAQTLGTTICLPGGTKTQRTPRSYTNRLKVELIRREGVPEELLVDFQLDHKIPLALGGTPSDPRNFTLQPWDEAGDKDRVEACLSRAVCEERIGLREAQERIWTNWREAAQVCPRRPK